MIQQKGKGIMALLIFFPSFSSFMHILHVSSPSHDSHKTWFERGSVFRSGFLKTFLVEEPFIEPLRVRFTEESTQPL